MTFNQLHFICPQIFAPTLHRCLSMMLQISILLRILLCHDGPHLWIIGTQYFSFLFISSS